MKEKEPQTLQEAIQHFSNFDNCREFMISIRWADGIVRCPNCGSEKVTYLAKARVYRCYGDHARLKFSLKVGTIFEDSPIPLEKWLPAVWMLVNCRNGVSSWELHRSLGITQKSAWFMLHRIRLAVQTGTFQKLGGNGKEIEADEAFFGGKAVNMHEHRRVALRQARNACLSGDTRMIGKAAVMGILDRDARKIRTTVIPAINRETLQGEILKHVEFGSKIFTDEARPYRGLPSDYIHDFVNHLEKYVNGRVHTNGLENFWSLSKRTIRGTYVAVEPFHLFRYLDEQVFRFEHRKDAVGNTLTDAQRFKAAMSQVTGKRLTFKEVTGKVGETAAF
jgi:transposase-like protein